MIHVANVRDGIEGEYIGRRARGRAGSPLANPYVIDRMEWTAPDGSRFEARRVLHGSPNAVTLA